MIDWAWFLSSSHLVDTVIALTLVEAAVLATYYRTTGRGVRPRDFALNMVSGLCLMLALRSSLVNANWPWIAIFLSAAGVAHAVDMGQRWSRLRRHRDHP